MRCQDRRRSSPRLYTSLELATVLSTSALDCKGSGSGGWGSEMALLLFISLGAASFLASTGTRTQLGDPSIRLKAGAITDMQFSWLYSAVLYLSQGDVPYSIVLCLSPLSDSSFHQPSFASIESPAARQRTGIQCPAGLPEEEQKDIRDRRRFSRSHEKNGFVLHSGPIGRSPGKSAGLYYQNQILFPIRNAPYLYQKPHALIALGKLTPSSACRNQGGRGRGRVPVSRLGRRLGRNIA